jgi:hypothetical protein
MKIPKEVKERFFNEYKDKPFTLEEAKAAIADYFECDVEKAVQASYNSFARTFLASFRDKKKVRECYSYEDNKNTFYSFISQAIGFVVKKNMLHNIQSKKAGLSKAERKIKKVSVIDNQINMFDSAAN